MEIVDILIPPTFEKSGVTKELKQAWADEEWIGTFNLWILQSSPIPALVYQIRSPKSSWAPGKFDVTAGGHYEAGEVLYDGLREVREELGKEYSPENMTYIGRKMHVSPDVHGHRRQNIVDIAFIVDNSPLNTYILEESEVYAIAALPIEDLLKVHLQDGYSFDVQAHTASQELVTMTVNKESFPFNWDNYHYKIVLLAERFLKGEKNILY